MPESPIVAISGGMFPRDDAEPTLARFVLDCSGKVAPRVCYIPTASGDNSEFIATCLARGELSAGIAFPDGVAAHYRAGKFFNAVSLLPDLHAYYVEQRDGKAIETALPTTTLP